jgi:hypothetical protein
MKFAAKLVLLLVVGAATAFLWVAAQGVLESEFRRLGLGGTNAARVAKLVALLVPLLLPALPLALLFGRRAGLAAAAIGWLPLAFMLAVTARYDGAVSRWLLLAANLLEGGLYGVALVAGAVLASRRWPAAGARRVASPSA